MKSLIILTCADSLLCLALVSNFQKQPMPNIVYILADDLGYGDVSAYNPDGKIATPQIDKLASEGMRFTDANPGEIRIERQYPCYFHERQRPLLARKFCTTVWPQIRRAIPGDERGCV